MSRRGCGRESGACTTSLDGGGHPARLLRIAGHRSRVADVAARSQGLRAEAVSAGERGHTEALTLRQACSEGEKLASSEQPGAHTMTPKNTICLWYSKDALDAARLRCNFSGQQSERRSQRTQRLPER